MDLVRHRLRNLGLATPWAGQPEETVRRLLAVQSQDYEPARWSIGQRTTQIVDADVKAAYARGHILRTHVLRPTWHFVHPDDIRWLLDLTAPRIHAKNAPYYRRAGLDAEMLRRTCGAVTQALEDGQQLTRAELRNVLQEKGVSVSGNSLAYVLMNAELNGLICSGAQKGRQHTYALMEERAPRSRRMPRDQALAELALRYFSGHGPATAKDLAGWSSLPVADVRRGIEAAAGSLERTELDGLVYWCAGSADARSQTRSAEARDLPAVHLLQAFDELVMGYSESRYLLDGRSPGQGYAAVGFNPIVRGGRLVGRWRRIRQGDRATIETRTARRLQDADRPALRAVVEQYGAFFGLAVEHIEVAG